MQLIIQTRSATDNSNLKFKMSDHVHMRAIPLRVNHNNNSLLTPQRTASFAVPTHPYSRRAAMLHRSASYAHSLPYGQNSAQPNALAGYHKMAELKQRVRKKRESNASNAALSSLQDGYALPRLVGTKVDNGYSVQTQPLLASSSFSSSNSQQSKQSYSHQPMPKKPPRHSKSISLHHSNSMLVQPTNYLNGYIKPTYRHKPQYSSMQYNQPHSLQMSMGTHLQQPQSLQTQHVSPSLHTPSQPYSSPQNTSYSSPQQYLPSPVQAIPRLHYSSSFHIPSSYQPPSHTYQSNLKFQHSVLNPQLSASCPKFDPHATQPIYPDFEELNVKTLSASNLRLPSYPNVIETRSSPQLPSYPDNLPISPYYTSISRLQPPEGGVYREPPMLNDKLFPRDAVWNEDGVGISGTIGPGNISNGLIGTKGPHLQVRGLVYDNRTSKDRSHLLDGISFEVRGGEMLAVMATDGEYSFLFHVVSAAIINL